MVLDNILRLLKERGETGKQMCEALGLSMNTVTEWKSGRKKSYMKYIDKIADHFGVSVAYLMGETEKRTPAEKVDPRRKAIADMVYSLSEEEFERLEQIINAVFANRK